MTLLGYSEMKGVSKRSGRPYDGVKLYYGETRSNVVGMACDSVFVDRSLLPATLLPVGADIDLRFDRRGYCVEVVQLGCR